MKRRLTTRTLGIGVVAGVLLYTLVGWFVVVGPKRAESARLDEEIAAATSNLVAAQAATAKQEDVQPIAVADIFRLAKAMPSSPDMPGILLELARIAEETGVDFNSITPQSAVAQGPFLAVPISVTFDGTFYALSDFLFRLRTLVSVRRGELHAGGRLFAVDSVEFAEGEGGFPILSAGLTLKAFVYGTDPSGAAVPAPADPAAAAPPPAGEGSGAEVPPPAGEATAAGATG